MLAQILHSVAVFFQPLDVIARREFHPSYILLDTVFLLAFMLLLWHRQRRLTLTVGLVMGVVYFIVDYGYFHLISGSRSISEGHSMFGVLLWMSMSYGFTNFAWIWLALSKDKDFLKWSALIMGWWLICPILSRASAFGAEPIRIERTTNAYHIPMLLILVVGYLSVILYNVLTPHKAHRVSLLWLNSIGIVAQLAWELALLIGGIRSAGFATWQDKLHTLVVNSLLETNLGMPYAFFLFALITAHLQEDGERRLPKLSLSERIEEINALTY